MAADTLISKITSATGAVTKAVIAVRNPYYAVGEEEDQNSNSNSASVSKAMRDAAESRLSKAATSNAGSTSMSDFANNTKVNAAMQRAGFLFLEVQYNPSTLRFDTRGGDFMEYDRNGSIGTGGTDIVTNKGLQETSLNCQLIFDAMNIMDSFAYDGNTSLTINNAVSGVGGIVKGNTGDGYSVKPQVEAFLGMLSKAPNRRMIFYYGKTAFHGELIRVNVKYTMFNKKGHPVRAIVDITIQQQSNPYYKEDVIYWRKAFAKAFKQDAASNIADAAGQAAQIATS